MNQSFGNSGAFGGSDDARVTPAAVDDVAFLARSPHRVATLAALVDGPLSRSALRETTGVSPSTIGRTLGAFERRHWVERNGRKYEITDPGAFVAAGMRDLVARVETERRLRDVWQWLPTELSGFTVDLVADGVVTVAEPGNPYRPVERFVTLLEETARFRFVGVDLALLVPCKDAFRRRVLDGMRAEIVDPPDVASNVLATHAEHCSEPLASGNLTVRVHDGVPPCGISIFDDRVAVTGYDDDSGTVTVLVDTDDPAAREWAKSTFETYRRDARPLTRELTA